MRKNLLLLGMLFIACIAGAAPRTQEDAMTIARQFLSGTRTTQIIKRNGGTLRLVATSTSLLSAPVTRSGNGQPAFYVYNEGESAFVIVSGDDRMPEILAYSDENAFVTENLPENIKSWLTYYAEAYRSLENTPVRPTIRNASQNAYAESVSPLLQDIQYSQDTPYNDQCPLYQGERSLTGCVATAAAQIMRYWKYPAVGTGTHSYTTEDLSLKVSFDFDAHPFDWDYILPAYTGAETAQQKEAVSTLMLACGVACDMNYRPSASGAYDNSLCQGLITYLGYDAGAYVTHKSYYSPEEWMSMIKTELNEKRPIYYTGSSTGGGHAFVIDGYDRKDMVHVNWGWGGYCNGYFELLKLDAEGTGLGGYDDSSYQFYQSMIVGLQPKKDDSEYVSRFFTYSVTFSNTSVNTGASFTATANGIYNMMGRFEGALGLVIEKDGEQTVLAQRNASYNNNRGLNSMLLSAKFPATLEDGTYELFIASKANSENRWNKVYGNLMDGISYKMVKSGSKCTIYSTAFDFNNLTGILTDVHDIYTDHEAGLVMTVKNHSDSQTFFGSLGAYLLDENDEIVCDLESTQEVLEPGAEITVRINNLVEADAGTYTIYPIAISGYYNEIGDGQAITVKTAANGTPTLKAANGRLENNSVESGGILNVLADLSISGGGSVNTTWVCHTYTKAGEDDAEENIWDFPFIEKGSTLSYSYPLQINAEPGQYTYKLISRHPLYYTTKTLFETTFTVTEASGVQDATAEHGKPSVNIGTDGHLYLNYAGEADAVVIYTLSGQIVCHTHPVAIGNAMYRIDAGLPKGSYILKLHDANDQSKSVKFIR